MKHFLLILAILTFACRHDRAMADSPPPIRLAADQFIRQANPLDINTGAGPQWVNGDDLEFDVAILTNGGVMGNWTNLATITFSIYALQNDTNPPVMTQTLTNGNPSCTNFADGSLSAINTNLSQSAWTNNTGFGPLGYATNFHARFIFPNAQTAVLPANLTSSGFWLRIYATTTNIPPRIITCLEGYVTILQGPIANLSPSITGRIRLYNIAGVPVLQIQNDADGLFYTLGLTNGIGGFPTLYLSDTGY